MFLLDFVKLFVPHRLNRIGNTDTPDKGCEAPHKNNLCVRRFIPLQLDIPAVILLYMHRKYDQFTSLKVKSPVP